MPSRIARIVLLLLLWSSVAPWSAGENVAPEGTGISGVFFDGSDLTVLGTPHDHVNPPTVLNDGVSGSGPGVVVDTWGTVATIGGVQTHAYVGILWAGARTDGVTGLTLSLATFGDGGWFGPNGLSPGAGGALIPGTHLTAETSPSVQVTRDGGASWIEVASTSDYLTVMEGHTIGGNGNPNPSVPGQVTITLTELAAGLNGIRVIGSVGGSAGPQANGFLAASELAVDAAPLDDLDEDGMGDEWESLHGVDDPAGDEEPDGLSNLDEFLNGTDPHNPDSDGDGLSDGDEVHLYMTNPARADSDGDGLSDGDEIHIHMTDPNLTDTDGDGFSDPIEIGEGSDPTDPADTPSNFAFSGTGIMGNHDATGDLTTLGTPNAHLGGASGYAPDGMSPRITDGVTDPVVSQTIVDTFRVGQTDTHSYVGVLWGSPLDRPIGSVTVTFATFFDGGWFGANGLSPGANNPLVLGTHISESSLPTIQVTSDGGFTWSDVPSTTDYLTALDGHFIGNPPTAAAATWLLDVPQAAIDGIRVIGTHGGNANNAFNGFLGVTELAAIVATIPTDGFRITGLGFDPPPAGTGDGTFTLTWRSVPGRTYTLFFGTHLSDLSADLGDSIEAGPGETTTLTVPHPDPTATSLFFRVGRNAN
ncbi:hypothetical protein BH23VER1_BH23VER1_04440 [soil metagenome]